MNQLKDAIEKAKENAASRAGKLGSAGCRRIASVLRLAAADGLFGSLHPHRLGRFVEGGAEHRARPGVR